MIELVAVVVFASLLIGAAYSDIMTMTIPNWVSIVLALAFPVAALATGTPGEQIGFHVAFGFAVLVIGYLLFQANIIGGGDAKLIAAAAMWTGASAFVMFAAWTAVAGGLLAITLLLARRQLKPAESRPVFVNRLLSTQGGVPYAVAILAGGMAVIGALPFAVSPLTLP